jgi:hypothetical protein
MKALHTLSKITNIFILLLFFNCSSNKKGDMLLPFQESGRWGIINSKGDIVIDNEFRNQLLLMNEGLALEKVEGGYFLVDDDGKESEDIYKDATELSDGLAMVVRADQYPEAVNSNLKVKFTVKADQVFSFYNGYARILRDGEYGLINKRGKVVIEPHFTFISDFNKDGIALAADDGEILYIDSDGDVKLELGKSISNARNFSEGLAAYYDEGWGFINTDGEKEIRAKEGWQAVSDFYNGYATYYEDGSWGVIDKEGGKVIRAKYNFPIIFENGIAVTAIGEEDSRGRMKNLKFGFINEKDEEIIDFDFDIALPFVSDQTIVKDGKYFYSIDKKGNQYSKNEFQEVDISVWIMEYYFDRGLNIADIFDRQIRASSLSDVYENDLEYKLVTSDFFDVQKNANDILAFLNLEPDAAIGVALDISADEIGENKSGFEIPQKPNRETSRIGSILSKGFDFISPDAICEVNVHFEKAFYEPVYDIKMDYYNRSRKYFSHYDVVSNNKLTGFEVILKLTNNGRGKSQTVLNEIERKLDSIYGENSKEKVGYAINERYNLNTLVEDQNQFSLVLDVHSNNGSSTKNAVEKGNSATNSRYIIASERKLADEDLSNYSWEELRIMRNEIFARYGYSFKSEQLSNYFGQYEWYKNMKKKSLDEVQALFTEIEKYNVDVIKNVEDSKQPYSMQVISERAFFHNEPNKATKRKAYVIKGDNVYLNDVNGDWLNVRYDNKTSGWINRSDVSSTVDPI